jgi:hypothetical protein
VLFCEFPRPPPSSRNGQIKVLPIKTRKTAIWRRGKLILLAKQNCSSNQIRLPPIPCRCSFSHVLSFFLSFYLVTLPPRAISADNTEHTYFFFFSRSCSWTRTTSYYYYCIVDRTRRRKREDCNLFRASLSYPPRKCPSRVGHRPQLRPRQGRHGARDPRQQVPESCVRCQWRNWRLLVLVQVQLLVRGQRSAASSGRCRKGKEKKEEGRIGILFFSFVE